MLNLIWRRLALSIPLLFLVSIITFVIQSFLPGDLARSLLGVSATDQQYQALRAALHLDQPVLVQYGMYIGGIFRGDFGTSVYTGQPVLQTIAQRLPVSLSLIVLGTVMAAAIGILLGVLSATRGPVLRRLVDVGSLVGGALPNFWLGLVISLVFAGALGWFPSTGYVDFTSSPGLWVWYLVLPVCALAIGAIGIVAKVTRDQMMTTMRQGFVRTLRAAGASEASIIWKHSLRGSGVAILTVLGIVFVASLSGTVLIENVFVLPGLGSLAVSATTRHDIPVIQGIALVLTAMVIVVNLLIDLAYGLINPKVRLS
ncbi:ABC transporter permease [Microbacterium sp. RG1]|uniref:ABC transporter permease n=1 Tax=Microbacterium sp. RG1 TaxID=2489212 RepID=UPI0010CA5ABC|nr:ABC transporter permease [Microbacterium sp. RG1]QCQ16608.1 ABC transporter permease [Microbacterium sp. RG1]